MLFERHDEIQHFSVFEVKSTSLQSRVFMKIYVSTYGWVFFSEIDNFEPTCTRIRTDMKSTFYFVEVKSHFSVRYNSTSLQSYVEVKAVFYCFLEVKKGILAVACWLDHKFKFFFAYFMP